jgi:hypothetical protein
VSGKRTAEAALDSATEEESNKRTKVEDSTPVPFTPLFKRFP